MRVVVVVVVVVSVSPFRLPASPRVAVLAFNSFVDLRRFTGHRHQFVLFRYENNENKTKSNNNNNEIEERRCVHQRGVKYRGRPFCLDIRSMDDELVQLFQTNGQVYLVSQIDFGKQSTALCQTL